MPPPLGHKILVVITRWSHWRGPQNNQMTQWFLRLVWKNMAVITRWSYKRGGRKAGFHCTKKTIEFNTVTHLLLDILPKIAFWCHSSCFLVTVWLQWAKTGIYKSNTSGTSVPHQYKLLAILKFHHAQKQNFNIAFGFKSDTADFTYKWVSI